MGLQMEGNMKQEYSTQPGTELQAKTCKKCAATLPEGALFCPACGKKQVEPPRKHRKRANGTGCISKLQGKRSKPWMARKNDVCIGTYATYAEAQKALERLTDEPVTDKFNMTFRQIYEAWLPEHERSISPSQRACYVAAFKNCPELHALQFRTIRKSEFQSVIIRLEEAGRSKSTCEKALQLFGQLSKWAKDEGIVQANHSENITIAAKQKTTKHPFTEEQIEAIQASTLPAAQITIILIATGCRPNELFSATVGNCAEDYFIGGSKTDAGRNRVIAVSPIGLSAYQSLLESAKQSGGSLLIDGYEGSRTSANFAKRDFKALMEEIGSPDMTPYNCRHTFITTAVRSGVRPEILERMVGHANISTTDKHYTHLDKDDILEAAKTISSTVSNKSVTSKKQRIDPSKKSS